jgi:hypothetical protein
MGLVTIMVSFNAFLIVAAVGILLMSLMTEP